MDFEFAWTEMKQWLEKSIEYLKERQQVVSGREYNRIKSKLEGLKIAYGHMLDSEKIYKRTEDEEWLEKKFSELSDKEKYKFFKTLDEKKLAKEMLEAIRKEDVFYRD